MKKIISALVTFALAISLAAPVFAATGPQSAKGHTQTQSTKSATKRASKVKKSTKTAHKAASSKRARSATRQTR